MSKGSAGRARSEEEREFQRLRAKHQPWQSVPAGKRNPCAAKLPARGEIPYARPPQGDFPSAVVASIVHGALDGSVPAETRETILVEVWMQMVKALGAELAGMHPGAIANYAKAVLRSVYYGSRGDTPERYCRVWTRKAGAVVSSEARQHEATVSYDRLAAADAETDILIFAPGPALDPGTATKRARLQAAAAFLPGNYRDALEQAYPAVFDVEQRTQAELARTHGVTQPTISKWRTEAIARLGAILEPFERSDPIDQDASRGGPDWGKQRHDRGGERVSINQTVGQPDDRLRAGNRHHAARPRPGTEDHVRGRAVDPR